MPNPKQPTDPRRRRWLKLLLSAGALGTGGLARIGELAAMSGRAKDGVNSTKGTVLINGQPAAVGHLITPGDTVSTGDDGYTTIVVGEHAFLVRSRSNVNFITDGISGQVFSLVNGAILSVFGEGKMALNTPLATIGIRGTAAYIETDATRSYICICYGDADLSERASGQILESVSTTHHEKPRYITETNGVAQMAEAPVINHTDAELMMLESLVGREVPFDPTMNEY